MAWRISTWCSVMWAGGRLKNCRNFWARRRVAPLYGSVDPDVHKPVAPSSRYCSDLSYLGTYAADRQNALQELFF